MKLPLMRVASWTILAAAIGAGIGLSIVATRELVTLAAQTEGSKSRAGRTLADGQLAGERAGMPDPATLSPAGDQPGGIRYSRGVAGSSQGTAGKAPDNDSGRGASGQPGMAGSPGSGQRPSDESAGPASSKGRTARMTLMALGTHDHYRTSHGRPYDLMIVSPEEKPSQVLRKARLAHPAAAVFAYVNTMDVMLSRAIEGPRFWKKREDWFLHDGGGERIRVRVRKYKNKMSRFGMNVARPDYQTWLGEQVVRLLEAGYDGVQLDNVETAWSYRLRYVGSFVSGLPKELDEAGWYAGEMAMMKRIKAMANEAGFGDREIIFNHMRAGEPELARNFLEHVDGANAEHWMNFEVPEEGKWGWRSRVELARKAGLAGKRTNLLCTAKAFSREEALFAFSSYLMSISGDRNTFWYGKPYRVENMPWHSFYDADLGKPEGQYDQVAGTAAFRRVFEKGVVLVNPARLPVEIPLTGKLWTETFSEVESLNLAGRRGAILMKPQGEMPRRRVLEAEWCLKDADASGKTQGLRPMKGNDYSGGSAVAFDVTDVACTLTALFAPGRYRVVV
jgi:hypothetical protein